MLLFETNIGQQEQTIQDKIDGFWQLSNHLHQDQFYIIWSIVIICVVFLAVIPVLFFFRLRRKHARERMKTKESLLHAVLDKVPYPVYLMSSEPPYDFVYMNRATSEYWKGMMKVKTNSELIDEYILKKQHVLKDVVDTGNPRRVMMPLQFSNDGDDRAVDLFLQRIYNGDTPYLLTVVVDVTSQIEAKEHTLLVERMKLSFLSAVSDELTEPLDDLLQAIEQFDTDIDTIEDEAQLVDTIQMAGHYVLDKIDERVAESLSLSSSHSFKQIWQSCESLNQRFDEYIQKVISRYDYMIDYSVTFQIQSGEAFLDTFLWMQALDRMVSMAIERMKHGMLRLTVGYREGYIVLFMEDDGPGYTEELQSQLYKYQPVEVDSTTTADLSHANMKIARFYPEFAIIRELKGNMGIHSVEDQGATQWLYIPLETRDIKFNESWQDYKFDELLRHCNLYSLFKEKQNLD